MANSKPSRKLSGLRKKKKASSDTANPITLGALVISDIVVPLGLAPEDQNFVKGELKWLFRAIDHLSKLYHGKIDRSQPIAEPMPPEAQTTPAANNQLLNKWSDSDLEDLAGQFEGTSNLLTNLAAWLNRSLKRLLDRETQRGEAGKGDASLQNDIKDCRIRVAEILQEAAQSVNEAYGILVASPGQLVEILAAYINPITLGSLVISKVITSLELAPDDKDFISGEVKWLFSAANNYQQIYQAIQAELVEEKQKLRESGLPHEWRIKEMAKLLPEIRQKKIEGSQEVGVAIPPDAQKSSGATNRLLNFPDENELTFYFDVREGITYSPLKGEVKSLFDQINSKLQSLDTLLQRETKMGDEGKRNVELQNNIRAGRLRIIVLLPEVAQLMDEAYGILVTTPDQLVELLED